MILIDTSVWIDYFSGQKITQTKFLKKAIEQSEDLCVCGVIFTEVLQGIRKDKDFDNILSILDDLIYLPAEKSTYILAAQIYRHLRKKGRTIRKPIDCIIAATCIENSAFILHKDNDFKYISSAFPLQNYT
jgi:hypothetical protein